MAQHESLLEGPIGHHLRRLALPMGIGIVLIITNNLVDTYFVGKLGSAELAAMSFTFPVVSLVMSIAMGLGIGATAAISRAIGQGKTDDARRLTTHGSLLALVVVAVISLVGVFTQRQVFSMLGAQDEIVGLLIEYMTIWYAGAVFLVVPMVGTGAMRASGDARTPMILMAVVAFTNLALDPILIFGFGPVPALGIRGAAIATVLARTVLMVATLIVLHRQNLIEWRLSDQVLTSWKRILSVGVPAAIGNALAPVATAVMTGILSTYGAHAVAAYGVASRVEGLMLIPAMAIATAMTPFVGQNWGGHHEARVQSGLRLSQRFVLVWGLVAFGVVALFGRQIGGVFSDDAKTIELVQTYLYIVPISYGASGVVSVIAAVFNSIDRAVRSTILSATRSLVLAVPLAAIGASFFGAPGVFIGITTATVATAIIAFFWSRNALVPEETLQEVNTGSHISRATPEVIHFVDELLELLKAEGVVTAAARPINTIGFYAQGYELGHVHRNGKVDFHVPPPLHDALIKDALVEHHRHHEDCSWVSHTLSSSSDVVESAWLLRVLTALRAYGCGEIDRAGFDARVEHKHQHAHVHPAFDKTLQCVLVGK